MMDRRAVLTGLGGVAAATVFPSVMAIGAQPAATARRSGRVAGRAVKTIDIHAHCGVDMTEILTGTGFENPGGGGRSLAIDQARLETMDRQGIDVQVLSVNAYWYGMDRDLATRFIDRQNALLGEVGQGYPGRFYPMATVALQHPELAAQQLEDAIRNRGLRGCSLGCTIGDEELASPRFDPFWKKAQDLGALVFLHPQNSAQSTGIAKRTKGAGALANVIGNPLETTIALSHMIFQGVFDRFPELRICGAHGGGYLASYPDRSDHGCLANPGTCSPSDPVLRKKPTDYLRQIYVDSLVFTPEAVRHLAATTGPRQIMIGTDYPFPWVEDPVGTILKTPGLSNDDKVAILGGTACRLLDIPT